LGTYREVNRAPHVLAGWSLKE